MKICTIKTATELQARLRDRWGVHINVHWFGKFDFVVKVEPDKILNERLKVYDTYEECLEEGLRWSLKYIKNNKHEFISSSFS